MSRIVSGIKPTGTPHLGNYFGAIRQMVEFQDSHDCYFFVADLHALNQVHDREELRRGVEDIVLAYMAAGIDPDKVKLFKQSDIPAHTQLCWVFNSITSVGLLERAHAYKDAQAKQKSVNVGLFDYPVLMAADIVLYQAEKVPVGKDQQQHVEIAQDIAGRFNHLYGETFVIPQPYVLDAVATVQGLDGRKMSKSYDNVIGLFEDPDTLKKKVMSIKTDSRGADEPKDPDTCNIFALHRLATPEEELRELTARYATGDISYKESKDILLKNLNIMLEPLRNRRAELASKQGYVQDVLAAGRDKASAIAKETIDDVYTKIGVRL